MPWLTDVTVVLATGIIWAAVAIFILLVIADLRGRLASRRGGRP